jgi:tyrosine aminotransferase
MQVNILKFLFLSSSLYLIFFSLYSYKTWTDGLHIKIKQYNLDPSQNWNIDLKHMESLINNKTKAILINNPGNPCGNVFSRDHLLETIEIADQFNLPIISDEIYEFSTFAGTKFHSVASISKNVPVLTCSG